MNERLNEDNRWLFSDYVCRSFRNQADRDYIAARALFRIELYQSFLWPALQAVEKYLKAILLFNFVPVKSYGHDAFSALEDVEQLERLFFSVPPDVREYVRKLTDCGRDRYLGYEFALRSEDLPLFDRSVWYIRRFCRDFMLMPGDEKLDRVISDYQLNAAMKADPSRPTSYEISDGFLERILRHGPIKTREALVWKNSFYYRGARRTVPPIRWFSMFEKPTHVMHPRLAALIEQMVVIDKEFVRELKAMALEAAEPKPQADA